MDDPALMPPPPPRPAWYAPLELLKRLVLYAGIAYIVMCVYLYAMQNSLLYPREALSAENASDLAGAQGLIPWSQGGSGASDFQGYVRVDFTTRPAPRGTIVLFHGNGGAAYHRIDYVTAFMRRGFRTFLYEYPGYGGRPGTPSEASIVPDARALVASLDKAGLGPVYVWGESLGAGVAAAVCADPGLPVQGLVLITPWDSLANAAKYHYPWFPVRLLLTDHYDSIANLQHFGHPICVIRATDDVVIPPALAANLYDQLPGSKHMIVQEGYGHDDWPSASDTPWWDEALDFTAPKR
jgi:pimeloyl-ACP methyl ester carboxylesterase